MLMPSEHMLNGSTKWDLGKLKMTSTALMQQDAIHRLYMHSTSKPLSRPTHTHTHIRTLKLLHIDSSKSVLKIEMCANLCKKQRKQTKAQVKYAASEMRKSKQETKNEHSKY